MVDLGIGGCILQLVVKELCFLASSIMLSDVCCKLSVILFSGKKRVVYITAANIVTSCAFLLSSLQDLSNKILLNAVKGEPLL